MPLGLVAITGMANAATTQPTDELASAFDPKQASQLNTVGMNRIPWNAPLPPETRAKNEGVQGEAVVLSKIANISAVARRLAIGGLDQTSLS